MKKVIVSLVAVLSLSATACGVKQSDDCKNVLACQTALKLTGTAAPLKDTDHGASGTCWTKTQTEADACTTVCKAALATIKTANATAFAAEATCKDLK